MQRYKSFILCFAITLVIASSLNLELRTEETLEPETSDQNVITGDSTPRPIETSESSASDESDEDTDSLSSNLTGAARRSSTVNPLGDSPTSSGREFNLAEAALSEVTKVLHEAEVLAEKANNSLKFIEAGATKINDTTSQLNSLKEILMGHQGLISNVKQNIKQLTQQETDLLKPKTETTGTSFVLSTTTSIYTLLFLWMKLSFF